MNQAPLAFLPALLAEEKPEGSYVAIVRTGDEFTRWLTSPLPGVEWLQVEGLLADREAWICAAQGASQVPLDVIVSDPGTEFGSLYRLADVRLVRPVRVTLPAVAGLLKALRIAVSLQLPVRILPGQPSAEALSELEQAAEFYLHDPSVESPIEFFHSLLAAMRGVNTGTLWALLEMDPALYARAEAGGRARLPHDFVVAHVERLTGQGAECAGCAWVSQCAGYFKWPDKTYHCAGVKRLFSTLQAAAEEMADDLATMQMANA